MTRDSIGLSAARRAKRSVGVLGLAGAALVGLGAALRAQSSQQAELPETPAPSQTQAPELCFRGRPLPRCRAFVLYELSYAARIAGSEQLIREPYSGYQFPARDLHSYIALEIGGMVNRDSLHARGATLHVGLADGGLRLGLKGRQRRWYRGGGTLDLSAGVLGAHAQAAESGAGRVRAYGVTAEVGLGHRDLAAVSLGGDLVRGGGRTRAAVHAGARLGSYPAVVGTGLLAALVAAAIAVLSSAWT